MGVEFLFIGFRLGSEDTYLPEQDKQIGNNNIASRSDLQQADAHIYKRSGRYRFKTTVPI